MVALGSTVLLFSWHRCVHRPECRWLLLHRVRFGGRPPAACSGFRSGRLGHRRACFPASRPTSARTLLAFLRTPYTVVLDVAGCSDLTFVRGTGSGILCRLVVQPPRLAARSEEHTSELQSLMRISYA